MCVVDKSGNLAYNQPAYQGGDYSTMYASFAVDGFGTDDGIELFNHDLAGWLYVDMGASYRLTYVVIYNRKHGGPSIGMYVCSGTRVFHTLCRRE